MTRNVKTPFAALALSLTVVCTAAAGEAKKAVATVGSVAVTEAELERTLGNRLVRIRTEEYNLRRGALEELINEKLLQAEAARRKISVEELQRIEIASKVTTPTAEEVEPFYEGQKERYANLSKEEAIAQIAAGMRKHREATRTTEFLAELRAAANVKVLIEPPRVSLAADGPSRGNPNAPVTIVEFADYECPFCARAAATLKRIEEKYGEHVRIVFRDYPLPNHPGAPRAAEAAYCAGDQAKYWEMSERLFSKKGAIAEGDVRNFAAEIGLDMQKFGDCLKSGRHARTWKTAQAEGARLGVQSTPTFFVNGRLVAGAAPFEAFSRIVEEELDRAGVRRAAARVATTSEGSR